MADGTLSCLPSWYGVPAALVVHDPIRYIRLSLQRQEEVLEEDGVVGVRTDTIFN
jgi:hypothetical protein